MSFRVQGAPSAIESNTRGAGMVEGSQLGDTFPGVLSSLQEDPGASRVSNLYYDAAVGSFRQPSFQRAFGSYNLSMNIQRFGDSGSVEINPDIYWKGPMLVRCVFNIPYTYHGPDSYVPSNIPRPLSYFGVQETPVAQGPPYYANDNGAYGMVDDSLANPYKAVSFAIQKASMITARPRIFYSWGAGYANLQGIRMNMGGAMSYVLDKYSNFIGIMASCPSLCQRAALMRASGNGTLIPDHANESRFGLTHETCEIGSIPQFSADGGVMSNSTVQASALAYGAGDQNGCSMFPGPVVEHWVVAIKTPQTNFGCGLHTDTRRPIDTRLFSSNFVFEIFTAPSLDTFVDSGTGYQPQLGRYPVQAKDWGKPWLYGMMIPQDYTTGVWASTDGLFPSMMYRQLSIPYFVNQDSSFNPSSWTLFTPITDSNLPSINEDDCSAHYFGLYNIDRTPKTNIGGAAKGDEASLFRTQNYTAWQVIAQSAGYSDAYGPGAPSQGPSRYLNQDQLPTPTYTTIINTLRLANDQLGAKDVLATRPDLTIYYPFQHMTTQVFFINQLTTSTGINPFQPYTAGQQTAFVNTAAGGMGFGGLSEVDCRTFATPPTSYQIPISTQIQIPVNPLTCMYLMVLREKDRMNLGYSSPNSYSPCLYWNGLELQNMLLSYSAQVLQRYDGYDEYHLQQLHERVEPLVVPFRGGCVVRRDLPLNNPEIIQNNTGYPGAWYNCHIYEFCMVDQLPFHNEAFFQQTPSFRGEMLNFSFNIMPTLRRYSPSDFDFRYNTAIKNQMDPATFAVFSRDYYTWVERLAPWCPGIPQTCCNEDPTSGVNWNLNNDNLSIIVVYAQNALWQLSPLFSKVIFARGA